MAHPDPTARLQRLRRVQAQPSRTGATWTPDWTVLLGGVDGYDDPGTEEAGTDEARTDEAGTGDPDTGDPDIGGPGFSEASGADRGKPAAAAIAESTSTQRPSSQRWERWRTRWVPEVLHGTRTDPGRRGALVMVVAAAIATLAVVLLTWGSGGTATAVPPATVLPASAPHGESGPGPAAVPSAADDPEPATPAQNAVAQPTTIIVSITGAVLAPGLVALPAGSRVADAIAAAGGLRDGVDITGLNLAAVLTDGANVVIGVPGQGVVAGPGAPGTAPVAVGAPSSGPINLNSADQATLETLPGVGPVTAAAILEWRRTSGPFTSVAELREVPGIGPTRFATLSPLVTV